MAICWSYFHHISGGKSGYERSECRDFRTFLYSKQYGLAKIIRYYNRMILEKGEPCYVLRYEDLSGNVEGAFRKALEFAGYPVVEYEPATGLVLPVMPPLEFRKETKSWTISRAA